MSTPDKPSKDEDEYFKREDIEKVRKLAFQQKQTLADAERDRRKLHHMKCPNCGLDLHEVQHGHVNVDTCFNCQGVFLRQGSLEQLLKEEHDAKRGTVMSGSRSHRRSSRTS